MSNFEILTLDNVSQSIEDYSQKFEEKENIFKIFNENFNNLFDNVDDENWQMMLNEVSEFSEVFEFNKSLITYIRDFIENERTVNEKLIRKKNKIEELKTEINNLKQEMNNITITKDNLQQDYDLLSKDYMRVINENEKKRNAMVVKEHVVTIEDKQAKEEAKLLQKTNDELNTKIHGLNLQMSKLTAENQLLKNKLTRLQKN
jgi:chromosome segregation ATPase